MCIIMKLQDCVVHPQSWRPFGDPFLSKSHNLVFMRPRTLKGLTREDGPLVSLSHTLDKHHSAGMMALMGQQEKRGLGFYMLYL